LEEIARGGMGVIYKARQLSLNRQVALKMILSGQLASAHEVKRFRVEAEAAAGLEHPNIVPIYEVGEQEGQHYFSMRLINGRSLVHHRQRFHDPKSAARLIAVMARAVHFAHQRGILHRDLKPSNILIDAEGNPHLTDFGLAKMIEHKGDMTQSSAIMGTPDYMAPEQAMGKAKHLTTAADIFSLGVILYEMIIGLPPFRAETPLKTIQQVIEAEPRRPSSINRKIDRDLETICLKCLEKDPQRRYGSAEALDEDLDRWLRNEPISARSVTSPERAVKWARLRPAAAALATVVILSVAGFVLNSTINRERLRRERDTANAARLEADTQRELAETNFFRACEAVETYLNKVTDNPRLKESDFRVLRKELLETAVPFYEDLVRQRSTDGKLLREQAVALMKLGDIRQDLGEHGKAEDAQRQGAVVLERLAADFPDVPGFRADLAVSLNALGNLLLRTGRQEEAREAFQRAVLVGEKLTAGFPATPEYQARLAGSQNNLGFLFYKAGRTNEAESAYRRAIKIQENVANGPSASGDEQAALASSYGNLGALLQESGRPEEAERAHRRALGICEKLATGFPRRGEYQDALATSLNNLGTLQYKMGRTNEAELSYRRAVNIEEKLTAVLPTPPEYRHRSVVSHSNLGMLLFRTGRTNEAEVSFRKAVDIGEKLATDFPSVPGYRADLVSAYRSLWYLLLVTRQTDEARDIHRRKLRAAEKLAADFPFLPEYQADLAAAYMLDGGMFESAARVSTQPEELRRQAEERFRHAIKIGEKLVREFPDSPNYRADLATNHEHFGALLLKSGRAKEAEAANRRAAEVRKQLGTNLPAALK